jgi:hypothetical protein
MRNKNFLNCLHLTRKNLFIILGKNLKSCDPISSTNNEGPKAGGFNFENNRRLFSFGLILFHCKPCLISWDSLLKGIVSHDLWTLVFSVKHFALGYWILSYFHRQPQICPNISLSHCLKHCIETTQSRPSVTIETTEVSITLLGQFPIFFLSIIKENLRSYGKMSVKVA